MLENLDLDCGQSKEVSDLLGDMDIETKTRLAHFDVFGNAIWAIFDSLCRLQEDCELLTHGEISECVEAVNSQVEEEHKREFHTFTLHLQNSCHTRWQEYCYNLLLIRMREQEQNMIHSFSVFPKFSQSFFSSPEHKVLSELL